MHAPYTNSALFEQPLRPAAEITAGDRAVEFLRLVPGTHLLVAIDPFADPKAPKANDIEGLTCDSTIDAGKIRNWVNARNGCKNVHWTVNEVRADFHGNKATKKDIVRQRFAHLDVDLEGPNTQEALLDLLNSTIAKLPAGLEPNLIVASGGGYQLLFALDEPLGGDEAARLAVEAQNRGLIELLGGDASTWNADRLFRLPWTENVPNAKKLSKGRVQRTAELLFANPARYTLAQLAAKVPPVTIEQKANTEPEIATARAELEGGFHEQCCTEADLPVETREKLHRALAQGNDKFREFWEKGTSATSGRKAMLASHLGWRDGKFTAEEYAQLMWCWGFTHEGPDYCDSNLSAHALARAYVNTYLNKIPLREERDQQSAKLAVDVDAVYEKVPPRELKLPKGVQAIDTLIDATAIPRRKYVMYPSLLEGDVCQTVGEPGISKSSLMLTYALAISSDREDLISGPDGQFGPERLHRPGPSIIFNAEDRIDEMKRRLVVAQRAAGITTMKHKVHLWSGIDGDDLQIMVRTAKDAPLTRSQRADYLDDLIAHTGAVFVALDPQVGLMSGGHENDADDMNALFAELTRISSRHKCAIMVVHHSAKSTRNDSSDMGMGRGSFAQAGKVRSQMTLTNVDPADAVKWGYSATDDLFQLGYGKVSYGPRPRVVKILRRNNATVGNGTGSPNDEGPFAGTSRERAQRLGDSAPELEIIGLVDPHHGKAANQGTAPAEDPHIVKRQTVAHAALAELAGRDEMTLSEAWPGLGRALVEAKLTTANSRQAVTHMVTLWLAGAGQVVNQDGQTVRVKLERGGPGPTAPWILRAEREELASLASLANESVFA